MKIALLGIVLVLLGILTTSITTVVFPFVVYPYAPLGWILIVLGVLLFAGGVGRGLWEDREDRKRGTQIR